MPQTAAMPARQPGPSEKCIPSRFLFGTTEAMCEVREKLDRTAHTNVPVLITGESGTGKEVIARYVHAVSHRSAAAFVRINCPAIPGSLVESELFGYEQGAFTGAAAAKAGLVESAAGGTLFFDGIGELEYHLQSKLLQLLQDGEFTRVGGQRNLSADARVICAANRPLEEDVDAGTFRRDLLYRINVVTVELPPLRQRRADILDLAAYFLDLFSAQFGGSVRPLSAAIRELLLKSDWPGNIRQLENVIKRYVILGTDQAVVSELSGRPPAAAARENGSLYLKKITKQATIELERRVILEVLSATGWNRRTAAKNLHISYRALLMKMKQSGLPAKRPKSAPAAVPNHNERSN
jgi:two-component system response regulator AtoC